MPDQFGGVELEDEFGGVAVEEESTPLERESAAPLFTEPPPIPEMSIPESGGGLPPRLSDEEWDRLRNRIALQEEKAVPVEKTFAETISEPISEVQEGLVSPEVATRALALSTPALARFPGVTKSLGETASGFTSPINMAMLGAGAGAGPVVARGLAGGFTADMARHLPELWRATQQAETPEEKQKAWTDFALTGGMTALGGVGTVIPAPRARPAIPPRIVEAIAKADAVGLTKSAQAVADVVVEQRLPPLKQTPFDTSGMTPAELLRHEKFIEGAFGEKPIEVETVTKGEPSAILEPSATEGVLRQERPEVELQGIREPQVEAAIAREPARPQGGEEGQVLLTGPEVIRSIETLPDVEAGSLKQKPAVEAGMKLTEADVPALEAARDAAMQRSMAALESGNDVGFKAEYGKNIWFSGAIEGARRRGPNYDVFIKEQAQSGTGADMVRTGEAAAPTASASPKAVSAGPVSGEPAGRPAVAGAEVPQVKFTQGQQVRAGNIEGSLTIYDDGRIVIRNKIGEFPVDINKVEAAKTETTPAQLPQTEISGAGAPPTTPPPTPPAAPGAPTPPPGTPRATLDDVYKIFEPAPREGPTLSQRASGALESVRTGFSSKFRPLNKLAEDVATSIGGTAKDVAGIFEQLKGSSGKAEADVYRFDKDVSNVVKGSEKDFNAYMFLRRSLDRLQQDAADIARAQAGENVPTLNRRKVSQYTIPELESKLATLSEQIGGEKLAGFNRAADAYQVHMDQALRLQVESGRMAPEVYDAIKSGNQFYAPFKVLKYIEESTRPEGSGRKVDTTANYVKAMEGIEDPNFKLGDMLAAARQNLELSRTLAEKNRAMQNITELAALDTEGLFVQKLKPGQKPVKGMEAVTVLESGQPTRYQVNSDVAAAIHNMGGAGGPLVARMAGGLFRAGATTLNLPFQVSNLMADVPRQALVSKYGLKGATDLVRYPMDYIHALYSSIAGDVFGVKNQLFLDFLDSGAAGATVQQYLTPDALRYNPATLTAKSKSLGKTLLDTIPQFANAIEQASKVVGIKRALRETGKKSGAELAREIPEAITEIRRFSGSPDFGRMGKWVDTYRLNLLYMFLNARIQGAVADVGRLTGRDGAPTAAKTWAKVGTAIGIPSAYLYLLNNSDEYREDYAQRPEQEKRNYWLIPKDTFITGSNGERMRDYWRVPKREIAQWVGNATESGMDFARQRDPEAFWKWAGGMAESLSPVNIQGDTAQERLESVGASLNPLVKAPLETATGRDMYRHRPIVPDAQRKASPELQYTDRTAEIFKTLADKMPDVAPEVFRSPLMLENLTKNFTAGLLTQFLPRKPVEGRTATENQPLLQRFQALPYTDSTEFEERIQKFERESADEQLQRMRDAKSIMDANKGAQPEVLIEKMIAKHGEDVKLAERIVDLYVAEQRGITPQERRIIALPVTQRAEFLADELAGKSPEQKEALLRNWSLKRIMTERVAAELAPRIGP